jgi:hypothetical protein
MAQQLKRWESPRKEGRNDKGRGGSARRRQKAKQFKRLKQTLIDLGKAPAKPTQAQSGPLDPTHPNQAPPGQQNGTKKERHNRSFFVPFSSQFRLMDAKQRSPIASIATA